MKKLIVFFLCIGALSNDSYSQTTIASENFENGLTFFVAFGSAPVYYSGNSGINDLPASSPFAALNTYACGKPVSDQLLLISPAVDVSSYSSIQLNLRLAAFSIGDLNNGIDNNDYLRIEISPDNGSTYYQTIQVTGNNNAWWSYGGGTGVASTAYDGNNSIVTFSPAGGGERTTDGYSTVTITNLPQVTQLRVRITMVYEFGTTPERMVIDDFKITGTPVVGPLINVQQPMLSGFTAITGNISSEKTYQVRGSSLTDNITINSPTGYQISQTTGSGFGSSITLTPSGGSVPWTTIYTRMNSTTLGTNTGDISHTSSGAATKNVSLTGNLFSLQPTVISTVSFSNIVGDAMTIDFPGGNGQGRVVLMRANTAISSQPADGVDYNANSFFGLGDVIFFEQYIVYKGNGTSVTVTGLSPNVTYHVSVFEYNDDGIPAARNYMSTGATGNATTANLNKGLDLTAANTLFVIDFDNTVANVNNGSFAGVSATTSPAIGELNSDGFSVNQVLNGGSAIFGTSINNGGGISTGATTTGNFCAFEHTTGNLAFGMQTGDINWNQCNLVLRAQNNTGVTINSFLVSYKYYVRNEGDKLTNLYFSYSKDNIGYTSNYADTLQEVPDIIPGWKAYIRSFKINASIPNGQHLYLKWSATDYNSDPGIRDKLALDDIQLVVNATTVFPGVAGNFEDMLVFGRMQLIGDVTVTNNVIMGQSLELGNHNITIGGIATGSSSAYLVTNGTGSVTINNISTGRLFPIGNSRYNPITITNGSNLNWTARVDDAILNPGSPLDDTRAIQRTWTITPSTNPPPSGANITFQYNDGDPTQLGSNYNNTENVQVWHNDGFVWATSSSGLTPTGTPGGTRTVTLSNWTQFSPFTVANLSAVLPVKFGEVKAEEINNSVRISWVNLTESNVLNYMIERSADGRQFNSIGQQVATTNNYGRADYNIMDLSPLATVNFYRIIAIERDGKKVYSQVVKIDMKKSAPKIDIYPNPVAIGRETFLRLWNLQKDNYLMSVFTMSGQQVYRELVIHPGGSVTRALKTSNLNTGVYLLRLTSTEKTWEMKLVVH